MMFGSIGALLNWKKNKLSLKSWSWLIDAKSEKKRISNQQRLFKNQGGGSQKMELIALYFKGTSLHCVCSDSIKPFEDEHKNPYRRKTFCM